MKLVPIDSGAMRHRIEIQEAIIVNVNGVATTTWRHVATAGGEYTPLQGRTLERAKSFGATINTTVKIRFTTMKIDPIRHSLWLPAFNKRLVGPVAINDEGQNRTLTIYCTEEFEMPIEGAKEMMAALRSLEKKGTACVRKAQRDAAKVSLSACIAAAPTVTGTTKAALKVRAGRRKRDRVSMVVSLGQEFFQGKTFYAAFNLFGHHIGKRKSHNPKQQARYEKLTGTKRKFIPGRNWMKDAWNSVAGEAAAVWEQKMKQYLEEAIAGKGSEE